MTAIEWLINEYFGGIENCTPNFRNKIEQAKQLEREQHGRTWDAAIEAHEKRGHVKSRSIADFDEYEIK